METTGIGVVLLVNLPTLAFANYLDSHPRSMYRFRLLLEGGNEDSEEIIRDKAFKKGVLAMPGSPFMPDGQRSSYVRASFSLLEPNEIYEALRRLREVLLEARAEVAAE